MSLNGLLNEFKYYINEEDKQMRQMKREDVQAEPSCHHSSEEREEREHHQDESENQDDEHSPDSERETKEPELSQTEKVPAVTILLHVLNYIRTTNYKNEHFARR